MKLIRWGLALAWVGVLWAAAMVSAEPAAGEPSGGIGEPAVSKAWEPAPAKTPSRSVAPVAADSETARMIRQTLLDWRDSWESKDLDRYLSFYSKTFTTRGTGLAGFREFKKGLFNLAGVITVDLSDVAVRVENGSTVVRFVQRYRSNAGTDVGYKTMRFALEDGLWRIKEEEWIGKE